MTTLKWDQGMSVGIKAIDDDHKRIIAILNKLTSAKLDEIKPEEIEAVFSELTHYVNEHFAREESLLEQVAYQKLAEHKESHQEFIEKLPKLKDQWPAEGDLATREEIISFLHQWLINHILVDDLDYAPSLYRRSSDKVHTHKNEQCKKPSSSFFIKIQSWLHATSSVFAQKVKLSRRVFITTLMPVFAVFIICTSSIWDNYKSYKNISLVLEINNLIEQMSNVTHSLQIERGLSTGYTSSNDQFFKKHLAERRTLTDDAISQFKAILTQDLSEQGQSKIKRYIDDLLDFFTLLAKHRQQVDDRSANFTQTYHAYSQVIAQLLSISGQMNHLEMNSELTNEILALSSVLQFKEYMGQIRALGMNAVSKENSDIHGDLAVSLLLGKQLNALRVFDYSANSNQKLLCADYCDSRLHRQLLEQAFTHVMTEHPIAERRAHWFEFMSTEIDNLKQVTDKLNQQFNSKLLQESQRLKTIYYSILVVLSLFLFCAILFALILNYSIINPVRNITHALNVMSKGQRTAYFSENIADDEIGAMQTAYEKLRRILLQTDIFQAIVHRQKDEIAYRKSQQAHFENLATTDALTGAVNRHQFNQNLADEITKANAKQQALSILVLDIDHFKQVNDNFGHGVGDEVLIMFYRACKSATRNTDVVARIGGEEFVIILPNTNAERAFQFAERLRINVEQLEITVDDEKIGLTVSIGVSQWQQDLYEDAQSFVASADKLLYHAKKQGRNKVVCA